ncbi:natriuretic peptides A [Perognathus longimembris pacificus]|uniref:natriuretic peptides A n=1 Tax=Perognathus longimembris pacificus TaxID=214514 RepID=UPI0020185740|nr:natriuretic peptides A [Perognathus longimembris pacificus]
MGSFSTITVSLLLFLVLQLPQSGANPVYNTVPSADLMEFKNLLDQLEEKMPLEEEAAAPQVLSEQNEEVGAALSTLPEVPPWTGEVGPVQRDGGALGRSPWDSSDRSALLKSKLRALLTAPRSLRRSSCFGGRIDRIGAQSGLGCNNFRYGGLRGTLPKCGHPLTATSGTSGSAQ